MRALRCGMIVLLVLAIAIGWLHWQGYEISYQNTASMPEGWYWLLPVPDHLQRGDIMLFHPPEAARQLALKHHWMLADEVLMKPIAALPGDRVCVVDHQIWVNHHFVAKQERVYAPHHALPQWQFCGTIPSGHYLLLSTYAARSFDGCYFGLIDKAALIARAIPIEG